MTSLKKNGLLRTYYRDRLRAIGWRQKPRPPLLDGWPERFSPYLTGDTDTNRLKSEGEPAAPAPPPRGNLCHDGQCGNRALSG